MSEDADRPMPQIKPISDPMSVPVFNVVIYVASVDGKVVADVANLPDLSFSALSEPVALKQAITEVKKQLAAWHGAGTAIPWIDPVPEPTADQQTRLVPVHL